MSPQLTLPKLSIEDWKKCATIFGLTYLGWFIWKNRAKKHKTITNRPGFVPIIGHLTYMMGLHRPKDKEPMDNFKDLVLSLKVDALHQSRFGNYSMNFILKPEWVKYIFEDRFDDFDKGKAVKERTYEILGDGIFASDGKIWRKHRKIGSKMFSMRNLKNYMFEVAMSGNIRWMTKIEEMRLKNNEIDIYNLLAIYTLDVFVEIAFGESLKIIEAIPKAHPFSAAFDETLSLLTWRFRFPFFKILRYFSIAHERKIKQNVKEINKFAKEMIESVEKENKQSKKGNLYDADGKSKHNILSLFLHSDPNLTSKELRDIAMNFIIAGRDTTRLLLSWFLYELSLPHNKDILQRIVDEIDYFYQHEEELTYTNIQNHFGESNEDGKMNGTHSKHSYFKYLEASLLETLRTHPPVPFLMRFAKRDVVLPGPEGHVIQKGHGVVVNTYIQGHDQRVWGDDASLFKPERFLEKGLKTFEPHKFLAFNMTPRLCLGRHVAIMEAKLVIVKLLQKYTFKAVENQKVTKQLAFVLNMENGFKINLFPRE